eukprot:403332497
MSEPPHRNPSINHIGSTVKPSNGLSLPTTKNQQNQQQFSKIQQNQVKSFARRQSLSKQIKSRINKGKDGDIILKGQLKQNDSIIAQTVPFSFAQQLGQDQGFENNPHSQNSHSHIQSTMFMTFQSSEKNFKRKNNASSSDKYLDSARLNHGATATITNTGMLNLNQQLASVQNTLAPTAITMGGGPGTCFLPDIHISTNQLKQVPDPKRSATKTSKQLMLLDEKHKFKSSDEELNNYFNFKESQKFVVSTTSTEPSEDQYLYKGIQNNAGINVNSNANAFNTASQLVKNRNTPKSMIGQIDARKNCINNSIIAASNQYCNKPLNVCDSINNMFHKSNQSAFDNYYNHIASPKSQTQSSNEQIILQLQQQFQINKPSFNYEDQLNSLQNKSAKGYLHHDNYANNAYQSPNIKGPKYQRKVSLEESILENSLNPQSLLVSKDNFHLTAQLTSKIQSSQLSKIQLQNVYEEPQLVSQNSNTSQSNPNKYKNQMMFLEDLKQQGKIDENISKRVLISKQDIKVGAQKQGIKIQRITKNMIRQSTEKLKIQDQEVIQPFRQETLQSEILGKYLQPRTDQIYEFQSKRIEFRRRPSFKDFQLVILYFDGLIGEITQKNLSDDTYQLVMRHGSVEALQELSKNFQTVIVTSLNQKYCKLLAQLLDKEDIVYDALYQRVKTFRKNEDYFNYNQVYIDFEVHNEGDAFTSKIDQNVIIVAPIFLDNEDIRDKDGDELIFQEKQLSNQVGRNLNIRGLPIDSREIMPITILVPHIRSQPNNYTVSMLNVGSILQSLLVTSCLVKNENKKEVDIETYKDREHHIRQLREDESTNLNRSRSPSPKRSPSKSQSTLQQKGLFMMTITTISPKNHFKKILALTKDKILDQGTCNWLQGYYQVKKYKLFSLKILASMKVLPEMIAKKKNEDLLRLKSTIFKLKSLYQSHLQRSSQVELVVKNQQIHELLINNEWVKTSILQYKNDFYNNLAQLIQDQTQNPLKELIQDLEEKLSQIQSQTFFAEYQKDEVPLYRFLVVQGHQFQSYPLESKLIIREKETTLQKNMYNWVISGPSYNATSRNTQKKTFSNPLTSVLNGNGREVQQQDTHFMPGYRIFSE